MDLTVNGLPLHPLLVHAVVVLVPLTAIAVILHAVVPAVRRRLGIVTPLAGLVLVVIVPITVAAGEDLAADVGDSALLDRHEALGATLLPWVIALFAVGLGEWLWFRLGAPRTAGRSGTPPAVVTRAVTAGWIVVAAVVGIGALVDVVLIGEAGSRAVWSGVG